jgi:cyclase
MKAGKTKEEIMKATFISGAEEWKRSGADRGIEAAYEELSS